MMGVGELHKDPPSLITCPRTPGEETLLTLLLVVNMATLGQNQLVTPYGHVDAGVFKQRNSRWGLPYARATHINP